MSRKIAVIMLLVGRPEQHLALMAIGDAQHLLAVIVVAAALLPQLGRLDGRHQQFLRPGPVLLLADDLLDLRSTRKPSGSQE